MGLPVLVNVGFCIHQGALNITVILLSKISPEKKNDIFIFSR